MFRFKSLWRAAAIAALVSLIGGSAAVASTPVDPETLIPPPPNATCMESGRFIICDTSFVIEGVNEPIDFGLPCGTVYETVDDVRRGIRWYDADTLTIVRRLVFQGMEGTWSLSPEGSGHVVRISAHANWRNEEFSDPFDESTWPTTNHGSKFTASAAGYGVIIHDTGLFEPDGTHHGVSTGFLDDPEIAAEICDAMGGDEEAFDQLVGRIGDSLHSVARRILRDTNLAQDATQQALLDAWRHLPTPQGSRSVRRPGPIGSSCERLLRRSASRTTSPRQPSAASTHGGRRIRRDVANRHAGPARSAPSGDSASSTGRSSSWSTTWA